MKEDETISLLITLSLGIIVAIPVLFGIIVGVLGNGFGKKYQTGIRKEQFSGDKSAGKSFEIVFST